MNNVFHIFPASTCEPDYTRVNFNHGGVSCSEENNIGSVCRFFCNVGYVLGGFSVLQCKENGWDHAQPRCDGNIYMHVNIQGVTKTDVFEFAYIDLHYGDKNVIFGKCVLLVGTF